jgi:hypothetical protein
MPVTCLRCYTYGLACMAQIRAGYLCVGNVPIFDQHKTIINMQMSLLMAQQHKELLLHMKHVTNQHLVRKRLQPKQPYCSQSEALHVCHVAAFSRRSAARYGNRLCQADKSQRL